MSPTTKQNLIVLGLGTWVIGLAVAFQIYVMYQLDGRGSGAGFVGIGIFYSLPLQVGAAAVPLVLGVVTGYRKTGLAVTVLLCLAFGAWSWSAIP